MPLQKLTYQLPLDLDLPEAEEDTAVGYEAAQARSEQSRKTLDAMFGKSGAPRWLEDYLELARGGWPWRVAAYIAWASSPRAAREPKTQDELARVHLGLTSDRAISTWRKRNPAIDEVVRMMQAGPLFKHRSEIFTALVSVAVKPDYKGHADRKLALELMGDYTPLRKVLAELRKKGDGDAGDLSDIELDELAGAFEEDDDDKHSSGQA
jgi:hypothetical protein